MGIGLRVGNKIDHYKSKRSENSEISDYNKKIVECQDRIDDNLMQIGQYYWNLYATDGSFNPPADAKVFFDLIEREVNDIQTFEKTITDRRESGIKEREQMDADVAAQEEQTRIAKEEAAEARRVAREEAAAEREKAAEIRKAEREEAAEVRRVEREKAAEARRIEREESVSDGKEEYDEGKNI